MEFSPLSSYNVAESSGVLYRGRRRNPPRRIQFDFQRASELDLSVNCGSESSTEQRAVSKLGSLFVLTPYTLRWDQSGFAPSDLPNRPQATYLETALEF